MKLNKLTLTASVVAVAMAGSLSLVGAEKGKDPKDIHEIMESSHKGKESMVARVRDGKGTPDEVNTLIRYYKFMAKQKPPEGDVASWNEKTAALVKASEGLKKGGPEALDAYKKAVNCKACHEVHKPKDEK